MQILRLQKVHLLNLKTFLKGAKIQVYGLALIIVFQY